MKRLLEAHFYFEPEAVEANDFNWAQAEISGHEDAERLLGYRTRDSQVGNYRWH